MAEKKKKSDKPVKLSEIGPEEQLKYEIAEELGLLDQVLANGWKSLSSKETGRIGGLMTKRKKQMKMESLQDLEHEKAVVQQI